MREHATPWGSLRSCCGCPFVIGRAEAAITPAEGVLERAVQHGGADVEERLHRRPVPAHLLLLVHALGHDLVDRTLDEGGRDRLTAPMPGRIVDQRVLVALGSMQICGVCSGSDRFLAHEMRVGWWRSWYGG